MRTLIAALNMTLDGFCDHTAMIASEQVHETANELFRSADTLLFGRKTFELMRVSWLPMLQNPTGIKSVDEFAKLIDDLPKVVFSTTMSSTDWNNSTVAEAPLESTVRELKLMSGRPILVGSPSLIQQLSELRLIDEYRLWIQPTLLGSGYRLFDNLTKRIDLKLVKSRTMSDGIIEAIYRV